jgi:aminopeptidase N
MLALSMPRAQETAPGPGAPGLGDTLFPSLGNGGYDVLHYTIDLTVDETLSGLDGVAALDLLPTQPLSAFNLDFAGLMVESVTVNGTPATFARVPPELTITPAEPLAAGEQARVEIAYRGQAITRSGFSGGWARHEAGVFVASQPGGAQNWFPVNDHPLDKATYTFIITVPAPYVVAANGFLKDTAASADGEQITYVWSIEHPMASYLATVNIGDFAVRYDQTARGLPIRNYFPVALADEGERVFSQTDDMLDYFETIFGPYPFDVYGVVVADADLAFALETQTLSLFGRNILSPTGWGGPEMAQEVVAHELAHQWFGNSVALTDWRDLWLNEGFASYAQVLWIEYRNGAEAAEDKLRAWYSILDNAMVRLGGAGAPGNPPANNLFNSAVYLRGGWTLHALRLAVGDDTFFETLRTYAARYQHANATTADFIAVAEQVSGQDLDALFDAWLYQIALPDVPALGLRGGDAGEGE